MASTNQTPFNDGELAIFDRLIQQDWTICSNCYNRTHDEIWVYDQAKLPRSLRGSLTNEAERRKDATGMTAGGGYYEPTKGTSSYCDECGDINAGNRGEVSKQKLMSYAGNVADRFEEIDKAECDKLDLVTEVRLMKSSNNYPDDGRILREAVEKTAEVLKETAPDVRTRGVDDIDDDDSIVVHFKDGNTKTFDGDHVTMTEGGVKVTMETVSLEYPESSIAGVVNEK